VLILNGLRENFLQVLILEKLIDGLADETKAVAEDEWQQTRTIIA
jgi:hypothetical protein